MEDSELLRKKREKIESLKADGIDLYPNDARVKDTAASIITRFAHTDSEALGKIAERFSIAGRLMAIRDFGKGSFVMVQDERVGFRPLSERIRWGKRPSPSSKGSTWGI